MSDEKTGRKRPIEFTKLLIPEFLADTLITLVKRMGGSVEIPAAEIDQAGEFILWAEVDQDSRAYTFRVERKQ